MAQRLAALLLAATVAFAGLTVCPRGALSCTMLRQANHACCGNQLSLRARNCCGSGQEGAGPVLSAISGHPDRESFRSCAVTLRAPDLPTAAQPGIRCPLHSAAGSAPPDTPITQHTQLLL
jgi:hypothetical protein